MYIVLEPQVSINTIKTKTKNLSFVRSFCYTPCIGGYKITNDYKLFDTTYKHFKYINNFDF